MKAKEFAAMNPAEIQEKVKELKSELFNLRFQLATGQLQNTMVITNVKRDIARAKTVLRQKQTK
ncbi:MAG: 50S ribosomal protein L29 [Christensenellaceae bacterium]|nr:50S ribosomal protein L29 [Christensenellaceae bacterium]